jgi:hypothetical protein
VQFADSAPLDCHAIWESGAPLVAATTIGGPRHAVTRWAVPVADGAPWAIWVRAVSGDRTGPLARYTLVGTEPVAGALQYVHDPDDTVARLQLAAIQTTIDTAGSVQR